MWSGMSRGLVLAGLAAISVAHAQAPVSDTDPASLSAGFWQAWTAARSSREYAALAASVDCACALKPGAAAGQAPQRQSGAPIDIAITRPAEAARILNAAAAAHPVFRANLTTGVPGLPGIYLGDNTETKSSQSSSPGVAAEADADPISEGALQTVIAMRTPPKVLEEATALVPAENRARAEQFRANLTTGIPGLPGLYLGDNAVEARPAMPSGYTPVAGGAVACPSR